MVLEKTLESPLDCKEIPPVHSEGDQPWDFFGRNDAKAETPILWPLLLRGSQAPRRAVCGTRGSLRTMHGGGSAPSCVSPAARQDEGSLASAKRWLEAPLPAHPSI